MLIAAPKTKTKKIDAKSDTNSAPRDLFSQQFSQSPKPETSSLPKATPRESQIEHVFSLPSLSKTTYDISSVYNLEIPLFSLMKMPRFMSGICYWNWWLMQSRSHHYRMLHIKTSRFVTRIFPFKDGDGGDGPVHQRTWFKRRNNWRYLVKGILIIKYHIEATRLTLQYGLKERVLWEF